MAGNPYVEYFNYQSYQGKEQVNKKLGCPNCQYDRCKLHGVSPFKVWWYRYINNSFMIAKYWVITLIKGEK